MSARRTILQWKLRWLAAHALKRHKPHVIAITGSVGKTSTKEAIFTVLKGRFKVSRNQGNYNSEIGVPLAILGAEGGGSSFFAWAGTILHACRTAFFSVEYPEMLILEFGADRPGDIGYLARLAKPETAVVTAIGGIPVHVEFFTGPLELISEKRKLVESLPESGTAVLNYDDRAVYTMKERTQANILTYGFNESADVYASEVQVYGLQKETPVAGLRFMLNLKGAATRMHLPGVFSRGSIYALLAAAAVGSVYGMTTEEIGRSFKHFENPPGRLTLIEGIRGAWLIDDTYNAAPLSMKTALDTLAVLGAQRKIAVLGDMRELGGYSEEAHKTVGGQVAHVANMLITIGTSARTIAKQATLEGMLRDSVFSYELSEEGLSQAAKKLEQLIVPGDLVLVKGSQATRLEKIVEKLMADPKKAQNLLVRQSREWKAKSVL